MKKIFFLIMIPIFLLGACQTKNHYSNIKEFRIDIKEIRNWIDNYEEAIKSEDIERILTYTSDDIVYYPPNQPSFSGKDNLRKWFVSYFNYFSPRESLNLLNFDVYDDFAYLEGKYSILGRIKQTGDDFSDNGKFINFYKRQSNGKWICTRSIWNSDKKIFDLHSQILEDFSGKWKLDISKSHLNLGIHSSELLITQKGNNLSIERNDEMGNGKFANSSNSYIIGEEEQIKIKSGLFTISSSINPGRQTFSVQEKLLSEKNGSKQELKRYTTYSLTAKGEILSVISEETQQTGTSKPLSVGHTEFVYFKEY